MTAVTLTSARARRILEVRGVVQGVGFRPTVYRLAVERGLAGYVRNDAYGVTIEIEGDGASVETFPALLRSRAPVASRIDEIRMHELELRGDNEFRVAPTTDVTAAHTDIPADRATCDECVRELFDSRNRRYRYPFITCTNCGPRFTIVRDLPYDRSRTTMSSFVLCSACRSEYDDPADSRFK